MSYSQLCTIFVLNTSLQSYISEVTVLKLEKNINKKLNIFSIYRVNAYKVEPGFLDAPLVEQLSSLPRDSSEI